MSDCVGPINIIPDNNQVILLDNNKSITVIDNNCCTNVDVTQPITSVVQILTGPMGPTGEFPTSGSFILTGSIDVSGSISASTIYSPYFTGSFYGNGNGIFSGSFTGSFSANLQDITSNGNVTTLPITASSFYGNGLQIVGDATITGSLIISGSNTFKNIGPAQFTGSTDITGSLSVNGIDYEFTSASFDQRILNNSASIALLSSSYEQFSASYNTGSFSGLFTGSFSGSLDGTASYALNSATASNILGGKATHVPFFITDTTLATSSIYQSGSATVIINQDNATTANPEALYVWQPSTSSINVISGKGNLNNYLQLNIQNTNQGINASSDVVATANNGSENDNYIDMGINSENFAGFLGGPNDAYLYTHGHNFWIGNINDGYQTFIFNSSSFLPIITLNSDNAEITGSLFGTSSWAQNATNANNATSASYALTASYASNVPATASYAVSSSYAITASYAANVPVTASYAISASHADNADSSLTAISASHADNADNALNANYAATAGNGGVTQLIAGSGITLLPPSGLGNVTVISTGGGGITIISGSLVTGSFNNTTSYTFNHNLNTRTPIITVFDSNYNQIIPQNIQLVDTASAIITFPTNETGFAIGSTGGTTGTALSSSYAQFSTYASTASYYVETDPIFVTKSASLATTGSNRFVGNQIITGSLIVSASSTFTNIGPAIFSGSVTLVNGATGSLLGTASYASNADLLDGKDSTIFATTGSNIFKGNQTITGSLNVSGSNTIVGSTIFSGSIEVSGSTVLHNSSFIVTGSTQITGSTSITGSFNVRDGDINIVSGSSFTRWGNKLFNYGQFSDTTTQSGSANTAYAMKFNTTDFALGSSIVSGSRITVANTGIYNLQFSAQLTNTANSNITFDVWFAYTGSNIANSNTQVDVNKSAGQIGRTVAAWNFSAPIQANDYVEIMWSCNAATGQLISLPTGSTPTRPAVPSVIATLTQIA